MKNHPMLLPVVLVALTGLTLLLSARQEKEKSAATPSSATEVMEAANADTVDPLAPALDPDQPVAPVKSVRLSYGLDEIAKMVQAGVDPDVVQAFIENSAIAYSPNAGDIVHLHELGAPSHVVAGLIRHGGKLRERGIQESKEVQAKLSRSATLPTAYPAAYSSVSEQPSRPASVTCNTFYYTSPSVAYADYPIYGEAVRRYVCFPRYGFSYPRYYYSRHYFPTYHRAWRPFSSYYYCPPRFVRYGVGPGSHRLFRTRAAFCAGIRL